ncbi:DUF1127 domain-containing protein [Dongia rigui]|uniref:DUF1127 domain-containing protein n=1 Tax=Dongia rigui TaxID=940149 RepID=A0ABU5DZN2_9PROT|nr:DUF1127 domain-containing protein [Dongia rigui]MDY0872404.1 DUF1127 domain-containing protein [Dongia rigui]
MTSMTHDRLTTQRGAEKAEPQDLLIRLIDWLAAALERSRQRRALESLSDEHLRDIGLSRADVAGETAKPFWRV